MTDIEIRHFLENFTFDMPAITLHHRQFSDNQWQVWIVLCSNAQYYVEVIPQALIRTEDDLLSWIMGFGIRAFATFLPSAARMRCGPAGNWCTLSNKE